MTIYTNNYRRNLILYWRQYFPQWDIPKGYHVHHITPVSCGGSHHPKNLIALHPDDHAAIHRCRGDKVSSHLIRIAGMDEEVFRKISVGNTGKVRTKEHKKKYRESRLGKKNPMYGNGHYITPEERQRRRKRMLGENNPFYGKTHDEQTLQKIKEKSNGDVRTSCIICKKEVTVPLLGRWHKHSNCSK